MIIIPMAGLSSRFFQAGFTVPKYMLEIDGYSLVRYAVRSFERYFTTDPFRFVVLDRYDTPRFVKRECESLEIRDFDIVSLSEPTMGQADTVYRDRL